MVSESSNEFLKHQEVFEKNYPVISEAFKNEYNWPEMDTLRHEACLCISFGLSQSAITLCNHLMESLLKYSLIYHYSIKNEQSFSAGGDLVKIMEEYTEEGINKFGHLALSQTIKEAYSHGLIDDQEKKVLNEFRVNFRNAYSHADKEKTFGNKEISVKSAKVEPEGIVSGASVQAVIAKNPIIHSIAQAMKAAQEAPHYFLYLDGLVRRMKTRVFPNG